MTESVQNSIEPLALEIRTVAQQMRVSAFLSFIYTADIVNRYLEIELAKQPISRIGFNVLHDLILHGGTMTPTDISKRVFRSRQSVTKTVDTLEKLGLVKREPIGKDRRIRKVSITRKGIELVKSNSAQEQKRISHELFLPLERKQVEELSIALRQVRKQTLTLIHNSQSQQNR